MWKKFRQIDLLFSWVKSSACHWKGIFYNNALTTLAQVSNLIVKQVYSLAQMGLVVDSSPGQNCSVRNILLIVYYHGKYN